MPDEEFHEVQLNGKQLVFLFMAATVVAVVIFLCGVMVGRGVPVQIASGLPEPVNGDVDPTATVQVPIPAAATARDGGAPISAQETLTYPERLGELTPAVETLKIPAELRNTQGETRNTPTGTLETPVETFAPSPAPDLSDELPRPGSEIKPPNEPAGSGFVVQVAAVRARDEADRMARRLSRKGYPAFVTTLANGPRVFRVRVGKYDTRREAESVAGRLEMEEQFKPWITR